MKVLYLIDSLEGYGAEKSIVQIALNLQAITPVFVHLYCGEKLKPTLLEAGIQVYSLNLPLESGYKKGLKEVFSIIEKEKPQIIHSTLFRADMVARRLRKFFPEIKLVGSFVSNSYGKNRYSELSLISKVKLFTTQLKDRRTAHKVDYFICNSEAIKKTNIIALGIPEDKIQVIYRGRCFNDFSSSAVSAINLKEELELNGHTIFLNVGRLIKSKGQLDLLQAFKILLKKHKKVKLLIAGEGPLRYQLLQSIKSLGLENKVLLLGYREDIPALLNVSNFFIFPSYYEGLPGALIEAIIAKKPSIVSDIPENKECFHKDGALFFMPGNINDLSNKMEEAIYEKNWSMRLESSFHYAEKNFKIKNISKEYETFYKNILN